MGIFRNENKKVRETIELYANGLVDKNLDMIMSLVAFDQDFLFINQNPYEKIVGAKKFYVKMKEYFKFTESIDVGIDWMFLSIIDNMAWVNSEMTFTIERGNRTIEENRSTTFILEKRRGDWFIVHVLNSISSELESIPESEETVSEETEVYDFENKDIDIELGEEDNQSQEP